MKIPILSIPICCPQDREANHARTHYSRERHGQVAYANTPFGRRFHNCHVSAVRYFRRVELNSTRNQCRPFRSGAHGSLYTLWNLMVLLVLRV